MRHQEINFIQTSSKTISSMSRNLEMNQMNQIKASKFKSLKLWVKKWECSNNKAKKKKSIIIYFKIIKLWTTCIKWITSMPRLKKIRCRTWASNKLISRLLRRSFLKASSQIPISFWILKIHRTFTTNKWKIRIFKIGDKNPTNTLIYSRSRLIKKMKIRISIGTLIWKILNTARFLWEVSLTIWHYQSSELTLVSLGI